MSAYWKQRIQAELEAERARLLEETERELASVYKVEAKRIQMAILEVFEKIQKDANSEDGIKPNDLYRNNRYWALLDYINERLTALGFKQVDIVEDKLIKVYEHSQKTVSDNMPSEYASTSWLNVNAIDVRQMVNQVWCLDGKAFSNRIWDSKSSILHAIKSALMDYVVQGKSPWEIAKHIRDITGKSNSDCYRIARTETAHLQIKSQVEKYKEYGFTHARFLGSSTCCDGCHRHDGEVFTLDEIESLIPVHPNCTCSFTLEDIDT